MQQIGGGNTKEMEIGAVPTLLKRSFIFILEEQAFSADTWVYWDSTDLSVFNNLYIKRQTILNEEAADDSKGFGWLCVMEDKCRIGFGSCSAAGESCDSGEWRRLSFSGRLDMVWKDIQRSKGQLMTTIEQDSELELPTNVSFSMCGCSLANGLK